MYYAVIRFGWFYVRDFIWIYVWCKWLPLHKLRILRLQHVTRALETKNYIHFPHFAIYNEKEKVTKQTKYFFNPFLAHHKTCYIYLTILILTANRYIFSIYKFEIEHTHVCTINSQKISQDLEKKKTFNQWILLY